MSTAAPHKTKLPDELPRDGRNLLFHDVEWDDFVGKPPHWSSGYLEIYDQGTLELMTIGPIHDGWKDVLTELIRAIVQELRIEYKSLGHWTLLNEPTRKALEADACYYIANEYRVHGRYDLDLTRDPPPDLAVEIDISRSSVNKLKIYAVIGVPEVWRFDEKQMRFYRLGSDGRYQIVERSLNFPFLSSADLDPFLRRLPDSMLDLADDFRRWVRETLRPRIGGSGEGQS